MFKHTYSDAIPDKQSTAVLQTKLLQADIPVLCNGQQMNSGKQK